MNHRLSLHFVQKHFCNAFAAWYCAPAFVLHKLRKRPLDLFVQILKVLVWQAPCPLVFCFEILLNSAGWPTLPFFVLFSFWLQNASAISVLKFSNLMPAAAKHHSFAASSRYSLLAVAHIMSTKRKKVL